MKWLSYCHLLDRKENEAGVKKGTKFAVGHKCFDRFKGANKFKLYMEFRIFIRYVIDSSNNNGNTFGNALLPA